MQDTSCGQGALTLKTLLQQRCGGLVTDYRTQSRICRRMRADECRQLQRLRDVYITASHHSSISLGSRYNLLTLPHLQHLSVDVWAAGSGPNAAPRAAQHGASLTHLTLRSHSTVGDLLALLPHVPRLELLEW